MLEYLEQDFLDLIKDKFKLEIKQYNLTFKVLKLNDFDILIFINRNSKDTNCVNSIVANTNIKFKTFINDDGDINYNIIIYENNINDLYTKIKKTIFDICLLK